MSMKTFAVTTAIVAVLCLGLGFIGHDLAQPSIGEPAVDSANLEQEITRLKGELNRSIDQIRSGDQPARRCLSLCWGCFG